MSRSPILALTLAAAMGLGAPLAAFGMPASDAGATVAFAATRPARTTLPLIERQVMCVTCKIPLNVAESPQADRERAFIRGLIAQGQTEGQVKNALVAQYGPTVLALPRAEGFDLAVYLVPALVVLALLGLLAWLLPRWRRRAISEPKGAEPSHELSASDAARLEADMRRFD